jgi:hypothetical protein
LSSLSWALPPVLQAVIIEQNRDRHIRSFFIIAELYKPYALNARAGLIGILEIFKQKWGSGWGISMS